MPERLTLKDFSREVRLFGGRLLVAALFVALGFGALAYRYYDLQINHYEVYRTASDRNRVQLQPIAPRRGLIYDRNGVLLAQNLPTYSLNLVVERVENLDATIALLSDLVAIDEDDVAKFRRRMRERRPFQPVPLRMRLTEQEIAYVAVNRPRLPGVSVDAELVRHYPHGDLFSHAIGYVGRINEQELERLDPVNYSDTHYIGKLGVERFYEDQLHGTVGYQNVETNARGRVLRVLERGDPVPGEDLFLHLDANVQQVAHDALAGRRGVVVAIDIKSGGVLALVSTPGFDPNLFVTGISSKDYGALRDSPDMPLYNRALQGQYPPASTIKPLYALAGLHYGVVTPHTRVWDPGHFQLPNDSRAYRDWKRGGHGWVDLKLAVAQSCDVYYYDLAHKLGIDRLHDFAVQFGLGHPTNIDNTHERGGIMPSRQWKRETKGVAWYPGETLSAGIGQGYTLATPLQMAVFTAVIANRGVRHEPRMVMRVGEHEIAAPELPRIAISSEAHWDVVIDSMREVIHGARGTGKIINKDLRYEIAGKTGTAQVVGYAQGVKYDASKVRERLRDHALFVGFAPVADPQVAVAVIVENGEFGSSTASPVARQVMDAWLLGPDGELKNDGILVQQPDGEHAAPFAEREAAATTSATGTMEQSG